MIEEHEALEDNVLEVAIVYSANPIYVIMGNYYCVFLDSVDRARVLAIVQDIHD